MKPADKTSTNQAGLPREEPAQRPGLRTIVAGSRDGVTVDDVRAAVEACGWDICVVLSGTARGADRFGEEVARERGVPVERYPADWGSYPNYRKDAGYRRNERMATVASALVAVWDGKSGGTRHMIETARGRGLRVYVHLINSSRAAARAACPPPATNDLPTPSPRTP